MSTAFGKGSICFLSFEQFAGVSGKSNEVFEYMSRTFDVTHVSPSIGPFFNLIPGISPQRRNEMEVGSKLRDKSDLVSNRRHYIQTLPRFVLLYFGTPPKRGKSIQPKISVFSEELLKIKKKNLMCDFCKSRSSAQFVFVTFIPHLLSRFTVFSSQARCVFSKYLFRHSASLFVRVQSKGL